MTRKLPEELAPVLAQLGHTWPEADEDGLRQAAGAWREFGAEAERLARRGGDSVQRVTGENHGRAVDAFAEHWRDFTGGGRGHLDDAQSAGEHLAGAFERAAGAAEHCKSELVSVLTELAAVLKKAADAKSASGATSVIGAVQGAVEQAAATAELETAKLKVAGLLEELGRQMKEGLKAVLDEPAITALGRLAQGGTRTMAAVGGAGGAAIGGVRAVSAVVGPDGKLEVVGPDGKKVPASDGLRATVVDGVPVVLGPDGNPVTALATGLDGKPLVDAKGHPVLLGPDGALGDSGLSVALDANGKPKLDEHGHPVLLGADGPPQQGPAHPGPDGGLLTADGKSLALNGPDGKPLVSLDHSDGGQTVGLTTAVGASVGASTPEPQNDDAGSGYGHSHGHGWSGGSGGGSGHRSESGGVQVNVGDTYDAPSAPAPVSTHGGSVSLQTDSVAVAPPNTSVFDTTSGATGDTGGGSWRSGDSSFSGGSSSAPGTFQLGPVGGGAAVPPTASGVPTAAAPIGSAPAAPVTVSQPSAGVPGAAPGGPAGTVAVGPVPGQASGSAPLRTPAAPGGVSTPGAQAAPAPLRAVPEPYVAFRPREEIVPAAGGARPSAEPELGLAPGGAVAAYLIHRAYEQPGVAPVAEVPHLRTTADSRPYGLPGGLGPVDPAHQAELVRRVPIHEDARGGAADQQSVLPFPDPRAGDWAEALNGGGARESGRHNNSVDIALSAVDTFAGRPICSAPRLPDGPAGERGGRDRAERELGALFADLGDGPAAHERLSGVLLSSGAGAQAVLCTLDEYGRSHSWNVVNHEGVLTYLDHQTARQAAEPLYSADHGLWAIALDAGGRSIDLTGSQLVAQGSTN